MQPAAKLIARSRGDTSAPVLLFLLHRSRLPCDKCMEAFRRNYCPPTNAAREQAARRDVRVKRSPAQA